MKQEFDIEKAMSDYTQEIMASGTYIKNRYALQLEAEIVTYVRDLERDYELLKSKLGEE